MSLVGYDHEGVIIAGPGKIEIGGDAGICFYIYGSAVDGEVAIRKLMSAMDNPYEVLEQFRLRATDFAGNEWLGGFTAVRFFADGTQGWPLMGALNGLTTSVQGPLVSTKSGVELLITPPVPLPLSEILVSTSVIGDRAIQVSRSPGRQVIEALGARVVLANEPSGEALWITAETGTELKHPFAERWLCEPLRILLGAPIYPRLMARNFGDGRATVTLLPAPIKWRNSEFALMMPWGSQAGHSERFWGLYADILTMIGHARTPDGHENLEEHPLTRYYSELYEAGRGSRWVKLLTLGSTIEALANSLMTEADKKSEFTKETLDSIEAHVNAWSGDGGVRTRVLQRVADLRSSSIYAFLRTLGANGTIPDRARTWRTLRNSVMHGGLVEPWPTREGDAHLRELTELLHGLTLAVVARG